MKRLSPRLLHAASGIAWAMVFAIGCLVLASLTAWGLAPLTDDRLPAAALPWFVATLAVTVLVRRPAGVGRFSGIALSFDRQAGGEFLRGLGVAAAMATSIVALQVASGWARLESVGEPNLPWSGSGPVVAVLVGLGVFSLAAVGEELLFRGYGFQQLARALTPAGTAAASALVFGLMHQRNPAWSSLALLNTVLFGLFFGLVLVRHRSLWLPIGLHLGWNFTLGVLGANISGLKIKVTALSVTPVGNALWSGGDYGPEACLPTTFAVGVGGVVAWKMRRRHRSTSLIWDVAERRTEGG